VETLVEEEVMVVEILAAAELVMDEVMVDVMDLKIIVATVAVIEIEEAMVVLDLDMGTKVVDMVVVKEDMMVTMKGEILVVVTMMVVGTVMILEISVYNSNQIMDPGSGKVLVEKALAVSMVVVADLLVEVLAMLAEGFKNCRKRAIAFSKREHEEHEE
jgi:hypothetical protein